MLTLQADPGALVNLELLLDGENVSDLPALVSWCKQQLGFPPYCHANLNSIEECLNDLSWLPAGTRNVRIRLEGYDAFLSGEHDWVRTNLLDMLPRVSLPAAGDEPARALQVVLECTDRARREVAEVLLRS